MNASEFVVEEMLKHRPATAHRALMAITDFGVPGKALARQLGCSVQTVSYWKSGKTSINEEWEVRLWELLGECVASKAETVEILKSKGAWSREMRSMVNRKFARAIRVYSNRPQWVRDQVQQDVA